mgnify:CR=1 FL=1
MTSRTAGIELDLVSHINQRLNNAFLNVADELFPDGFSSRDAARSFIEVSRYIVIVLPLFAIVMMYDF